MNDVGDQGERLGDKEKLQILLAEYNAGRAALLQRHTTLIQFFIVAVTAFVALVGFLATNRSSIEGATIAGVILWISFLFAYRFIQTDIQELSNNVRNLEEAINTLVG